jgi:hypothetical protein
MHGEAMRATFKNLLARVEALDLDDLSRLLDALAGMQQVQDAGWRLQERRESIERLAVRNDEIRRRHSAGATYGMLAAQFGVTRSAIAKVCQRGRKKCTPSKNVNTLMRVG